MMKFRRATEQDIIPVASIYNKIHSAEEAGILTTGWVRNIYPTKSTAGDAVKRKDLFVETDDSGVIIGAAVINQIPAEGYEKARWKYPADNQDIMILHTLVIRPELSGKGYGRAFVEFYERYVVENRCRYVRLDTNERNTRARGLYRTLGYSEIDMVRTAFNGLQDITLVLLEKELVFKRRCTCEHTDIRNEKEPGHP